MNTFVVENGQQVKEGEIIGYIGGSGYAKPFGLPVHLHYEIHTLGEDGQFHSMDPIGEDGNLIDPQSWIDPNSSDNLPEGDDFDITDESGEVIGHGTSYSGPELTNWIDNQIEREENHNLLDVLYNLFKAY